jgi:hypothetical protein
MLYQLEVGLERTGIDSHNLRQPKHGKRYMERRTTATEYRPTMRLRFRVYHGRALLATF